MCKNNIRDQPSHRVVATEAQLLEVTKDTPSDAVSIAEILPPTVEPTVCSDDTSAKIEPSAPSGTICPIITQIGIEINWFAITPTRSSPIANTCRQ